MSQSPSRARAQITILALITTTALLFSALIGYYQVSLALKSGAARWQGRSKDLLLFNAAHVIHEQGFPGRRNIHLQEIRLLYDFRESSAGPLNALRIEADPNTLSWPKPVCLWVTTPQQQLLLRHYGRD